MRAHRPQPTAIPRATPARTLAHSRTAVQSRTLAHPLAILIAALAILTAFAALTPARAASADPLDRAMAATLVIRTADAEDRFLGSGFVWGDGGLALTNAHVVGDAAEVRVIHRDGREEIAEVMVRDAVRDLAVIAIGPGAAPGLVSAPSPALGLTVYAIGAPLGIEFSLTRGMVSALARQVEAAVPMRFVQHDAAVNPGSSGGPLVDAEGRLVGMNSRIADGSRLYAGISYAISAVDIDRLVPQLLSGDLPPVPSLGLRARSVTRRIAAALGVEAGGVLLDHVAAGGLAARAGMRPGDVIVTVDGAAIATPGDLSFAVDAAVVREQAQIVVRRDGAEVAMWLPLRAEAPTVAFVSRSAGVAAGRVETYTFAGLGVEITPEGNVRALTDSSPARWAGLSVGDRVLTVDGVRIAEIADLAGRVVTGPVLLLVRRVDGSTQHVLIDPWETKARFRPVGGANVLDPEVVVF